MSSPTLKEIIDSALKEDMPNGDATTDNLGLSNRPGIAHLKAKQDLVLSGKEAFELTVQICEPDAKIKWHFEDGSKVLKGQQLAVIQCDLLKLLKAERTALNLLNHLSGVATLTSLFVDRIKHTRTKILDTRKTTPLLRDLEKIAVKNGGGTNHRLNLSSAVMIKDNHIRAAGSITAAVAAVRSKTRLHMTVEASNLEEVRECVESKVQRIMLDNMSLDEMREALRMIPKDIETEASGNMNLDRVVAVAELGVNFISVGALTHSAPVADISLLFDWSK